MYTYQLILQLTVLKLDIFSDNLLLYLKYTEVQYPVLPVGLVLICPVLLFTIITHFDNVELFLFVKK